MKVPLSLLLSTESFVMLLFYVIYCRRKLTTCSFRVVRDKNLYGQLFSFSGWSLVGSATNVATQNGFIFLLNIFCGVAVNAAMGIANHVNTAVVSFVSSFQTSYRPQIVKSYAKGDISHLNKLIATTSKISFSLMIIPTLILLVNMPLVLELWLGNVPNYAVEFCQLILICVIIDAITGSYNAAIMATGRIKKYQLSISMSFLLDLIVSFALLKIGIQPYMVLFSRIFTRGILNMFIGLYFIKKELGFRVSYYFRNCIVPIIVSLLICIPMTIFLRYSCTGWTLLVASSITISIVMATTLLFIVFKKEERNYIISLILKRTRLCHNN